MKTALTIAGSDSSGGAGIQADLKTMTMNGVFAMSAITALTAQNTTGVSGIMNVTPEFLAQEIDAVFTDIRPDAVKIGMVSDSALICTIAERLRFYEAGHIVCDPVMVATSGSRLISEDAIGVLREQLLPLAGQEAAEAHAGVHQHMGLPLHPQGFRGGVHGGARLVGADGADGLQAEQSFQLGAVGGGAQHQDGLGLEARLPEAAHVLRLVHGEVVDALLPQEPGQLHQTRAVAVAHQDGEDDRRARPLPDGGDVVLQRRFVKNQLFHSNPPSLFWVCKITFIIPCFGAFDKREGVLGKRNPAPTGGSGAGALKTTPFCIQ